MGNNFRSRFWDPDPRPQDSDRKPRPQDGSIQRFHVEFQVRRQWALADNRRKMPDLYLPRNEVADIDIAFCRAREFVHEKRALTLAAVKAKTEKLLDTNRSIWD